MDQRIISNTSSSSVSSSSSSSYWETLEHDITAPLVITNSCFSIIGSVFIIICQIFVNRIFWMKRGEGSDATSTSTSRPSPLHHSLVFGLTVAHFFLSIEWILSIILKLRASQSIFDSACRYLAPFKFYTWIVILFYIVFVGIEVVYRYRNCKVSTFDETILPLSFPIKKRYIHAAIILIPLPSIPILAVLHAPDENKEQCWWDPTLNNSVSYTLELVALIAWLICCSCYLYTILLFKSKVEQIVSTQSAENKKMRLLYVRMSSYLLVFLILWGPLFIAEAYTLYIQSKWQLADFPVVMNLVLSSLRPLTGFFNAIVYGFEPELWKKLKGMAKRERREGRKRVEVVNVQEADTATEDDRLFDNDYSTPTYDIYVPWMGSFNTKRSRLGND